jgi:autotransporter-associated beta strand protein
MNLKFRSFRSQCLVQGQRVLLALALAATANAASTWQWNGTTSTAWNLSGNWASSPGLDNHTNGTFLGDRLNVANTAGYELIYSAAQGTTVYGGTSRGFVIGSGEFTPGRMHITGGTFSSAASTGTSQDVLGNAYGTNTLILDGGNYISGSSGLYLGYDSTGQGAMTSYNQLLMTNGTATITTLQSGGAYGGAFSGDTNLISLVGGTLIANSIVCGDSLYPTVVYTTNFTYTTLQFNGGTLKAGLTTNSYIIPAHTNLFAAIVSAGGAVIDTTNFSITIAPPLVHDSALGATADGGLTKLGTGTLTLAGTNAYTGATVVKAGTLAVTLPMTSAAVAINSNATLNVTANSTNRALSTLAMTNGAISFNYGVFNGNTSAFLKVTNLTLVGTNMVNLIGSSFPLTNLTLLTYSGKTGGGQFVLGTVPGGTATLVDNGSSVVLQALSPTAPVTNIALSASASTLIVGGSSTTIYDVITPTNATSQTVIWNNDNPGVVSTDVDATGTNCTLTPVSAGTAHVWATTTDGSNLWATNLVMVTPATPIVQTETTASPIFYGQTLASSTITAGSFTNLAGAAVGIASYGFVNPTIAPNAGTTSVLVYFVPSDMADYLNAISTVTVTVNAAPAARLNGTMQLGGGKFMFAFTNYTGLSFAVLATNNLTVPRSSWPVVGYAVENPAGSGNYQYTNTAATNGQQYYITRLNPGGVTINPVTYGLDITGKTDTSGAFQTMINSFPSGSTLRLPTGTYWFTNTVNIKDGITLVASKDARIIGTGNNVLFSLGCSNTMNGIDFENCYQGISISGKNTVNVFNCVFTNNITFAAINFYGSSSCSINNSYFSGIGKYGVLIDADSSDITIDSNVFQNAAKYDGYGTAQIAGHVYCLNGTRITVSNNTLNNSGGQGVIFCCNSTTGKGTSNSVIFNNLCTGNGQEGATVYGGSTKLTGGNSVIGNYCSDNRFNQLEIYQSDNNIVQGNTVSEPVTGTGNLAAICLFATTGTICTGNTVLCAQNNGIDIIAGTAYTTVSGNVIKDTNREGDVNTPQCGNGILLDWDGVADPEHITITNNTISSSSGIIQKSGVYSTSNVHHHNTISGNTITGYLYGVHPYAQATCGP